MDATLTKPEQALLNKLQPLPEHEGNVLTVELPSTFAWPPRRADRQMCSIQFAVGFSGAQGRASRKTVEGLIDKGLIVEHGHYGYTYSLTPS